MPATGQLTGNKKRDGFFIYGFVLMVAGGLVALSALAFHTESLYYAGAVIAAVGVALRVSSLFLKR